MNKIKMIAGIALALSTAVAQAEPVWMPGGRVSSVASAAGSTPGSAIVVQLPWSIQENDPAENCAFFGPTAFYATFDPAAPGGPAILEVIKLATVQNLPFAVNLESDTCAIIDVSTDVNYSFPP